MNGQIAAVRAKEIVADAFTRGAAGVFAAARSQNANAPNEARGATSLKCTCENCSAPKAFAGLGKGPSVRLPCLRAELVGSAKAPHVAMAEAIVRKARRFP